MKVVIQRVAKASVSISNIEYSAINNGLLVFVGFNNMDNSIDIEKITKKIINLRIFSDLNHKMNLSLNDINGELLIVSQFTLYANCKKGNRPSFIESASSIDAENIYNQFVNYIKSKYKNVKTGKFGELMDINLINNGPVTIQLDSEKL